jgi:hypothetical protein
MHLPATLRCPFVCGAYAAVSSQLDLPAAGDTSGIAGSPTTASFSAWFEDFSKHMLPFQSDLVRDVLMVRQFFLKDDNRFGHRTK